VTPTYNALGIAYPASLQIAEPRVTESGIHMNPARPKPSMFPESNEGCRRRIE